LTDFHPEYFASTAWALLSFFRFVTNHAFDRRTDRQTDGWTEFSSLDRVCIPCSAVKTGHRLRIPGHLKFS